MDNTLKIPKIRFKGFNDVWEQRKLESLFNKGGSGGTPSSTNPNYYNGSIPFLSITDISNSDGYIYDTEKHITELGLSNSTAWIVQKEAIALAMYASVGKVAILKEDAATSQAFYNMIFDSNITRNYIYEYLKKMESNNEWLRYISTGTQANLNAEKVKNLVISIPSNMAEQDAIGRFLIAMDNLITLHQRKCDKLISLKKSMLEKMFPKDGSLVPEIRFSGFNDVWEQRKFSDITYPAGEKNRENLPLESYSITNESGFVPQNEKFENGGTMREADKRMYYIVSPNSFAYNPARINVGSIGYQNTAKNVIVSSLYEVFKTTEDVDDRLLWHWFKSHDFQKLIVQLQEGGVRLYFYYDKLCMGQVALPKIEEQRKIGQFLDSLDNLITLHQRELKKLQNLKKSMLEKMFI
jgi:type I restriction enzyme S subunit